MGRERDARARSSLSRGARCREGGSTHALSGAADAEKGVKGQPMEPMPSPGAADAEKGINPLNPRPPPGRQMHAGKVVNPCNPRGNRCSDGGQHMRALSGATNARRWSTHAPSRAADALKVVNPRPHRGHRCIEGGQPMPLMGPRVNPCPLKDGICIEGVNPCPHRGHRCIEGGQTMPSMGPRTHIL
jgi:hypothetical protein